MEQATTGHRGSTVNQHVQEQAGSTLARYGHSELTGYIQTVYWILAASKGWIKQTYRKIMHTQNTLYNMHKITSLEMI